MEQAAGEDVTRLTEEVGATLRRVTATVDLRFSTRYEMEGLLREAGLELHQLYGDFDLSSYGDESEYLITVARKPAKESP